MVGWTPSSPSNIVQKTAQSLIWDAASSQPVMGVTFYFSISRLVSAKEVKLPPPKIAPHFHVRSAASNPAEGGRSGNKNIFRSSLTPSGSSLWKVSAITINVTVWGICGGRKRGLSTVHRQSASIAAQALYVDPVFRRLVNSSSNPKLRPYLHLWGGVGDLLMCLIPPTLCLGRGGGPCCRMGCC